MVIPVKDERLKSWLFRCGECGSAYTYPAKLPCPRVATCLICNELLTISPLESQPT